MVTVHAAIGNSDDKLSQLIWSEYIRDFQQVMTDVSNIVHGVWFSAPNSQFQNCVIAAEMYAGALPALKSRLIELRKRYEQDSIAVNVSESEFV